MSRNLLGARSAEGGAGGRRCESAKRTERTADVARHERGRRCVKRTEGERADGAANRGATQEQPSNTRVNRCRVEITCTWQNYHGITVPWGTKKLTNS